MERLALLASTDVIVPTGLAVYDLYAGTHARKVMAMAGVYGELRDLIQRGRFHTGAATLLKAVAGRTGSLAQLDRQTASTDL